MMPSDLDLFGGVHHGDATHLGPLVDYDNNPLQTPNGPRRLNVQTVGGPESGRDQRLYLDVPTLERWLEVAKASPRGRVQFDMVGVKATTYQGRDGHYFVVWQLISRQAKPEAL